MTFGVLLVFLQRNSKVKQQIESKMKKTLILGLIAMMALVANAQDDKKSLNNSCKIINNDNSYILANKSKYFKNNNKTEKCEKKDCCKKDKKCDKKACDKDAKSSDKAKKTDGQTGATKQEK